MISSTIQWRGSIHDDVVIEYIRVDTRDEFAEEVEKLIKQVIQDSGMDAWYEGPLPSLASRGPQRWARFQVYVEVSPTGGECPTILDLMKRSGLAGVAILGERKTLDDMAGMMMEVSSHDAGIRVQEHVKNAIAITNSKMVFTTDTPRETWMTILTQIFEDANGTTISSIKDRQGIIWARPLLLQEEVDATTRRLQRGEQASLPPGSSSTSVTISCIRLMGASRAAQARHI